MTEKELIKMELHETYIIKDKVYWVVRVVGGWIYYRRETITICSGNPNAALSVTATFVPEIYYAKRHAIRINKNPKQSARRKK